MMLPYLEQTALYNAANFATGPNFWNGLDAMNATVQTTKINFFICPSDVNRLTFSPAFGPTNYAANAGADAFSLQSGSSGRGVVGSANQFSGPFPSIGVMSRLADITDGTSNTVAFSEIVTGIGTSASNFDSLRPSASPFRAGVATSGTATTVGNPQADYNACKAAAATAANVAAGGFPLGATWWWGRSGVTRYTHVMPPNSQSCVYTNGTNSDSDAAAITAGSRHPGVVNCLMMDASVRAVKSTVSTTTWWGLATRGGGEIISSDSL